VEVGSVERKISRLSDARGKRDSSSKPRSSCVQCAVDDDGHAQEMVSQK